MASPVAPSPVEPRRIRAGSGASVQVGAWAGAGGSRWQLPSFVETMIHMVYLQKAKSNPDKYFPISIRLQM